MPNDEKKIEEVLSRGVAEVIGREHLKARLLRGEPLRVKFGIDPTSPHIHLGRAVALLKLRDFQELGCTVMFIVGDFTGQIGDTSDKESERPMLSEEVVRSHLATYLKQASLLLYENRTEVFSNSQWLSELSFRKVGDLATWFSLHDFIARENIKKRLEEGKRISLREVLYPLMQGYDSLMMDADLEIGGTDQRFNMLAGREIQRHADALVSPEHARLIEERIGGSPRRRSGSAPGDDPLAEEPQDVLMMNLIPGTDGRKMSSSFGNTINLTDAPNEMFGRVMSLPDDLIGTYFVHCTRVPMREVAAIETALLSGGNPRDAKMRLAKEIVRLYHGVEPANEAERYFIETFSRGLVPKDVLEVKVKEDIKLVDAIVMAGVAESKSDARRKIEQGGVELNGEKVTDGQMTLGAEHSGHVLKVGKKDFVRIVF